MNMLRERERTFDEKTDYGFRGDYFAQRREDAFEQSLRDRGFDDYRSDRYAQSDDYGYRSEATTGYRRTEDFDYVAPRYDFGQSYRSREEERFDDRYDYREDYRDDRRVDEYAYGEERSAFAPIEFREQPRKASSRSRSKFLIAVYFALVALIASLVITNVVMFNGESVVEAETPAADYDASIVYTAVTEDGTTESLTTDRLEGYEYDTTTNWFDEFCDMLSR